MWIVDDGTAGEALGNVSVKLATAERIFDEKTVYTLEGFLKFVIIIFTLFLNFFFGFFKKVSVQLNCLFRN